MIHSGTVVLDLPLPPESLTMADTNTCLALLMLPLEPQSPGAPQESKRTSA